MARNSKLCQQKIQSNFARLKVPTTNDKKTSRTNREAELPIASKTNRSNFYMENLIKMVETPEEAIEVFNQLRPRLS